jgi:mercuric ion transport protein
MADRKLLGIGIGGGVITALCCATPVLAIFLGAVGLAAWLAWLDYVLLPLLVFFIGLAVYAVMTKPRFRRDTAHCEVESDGARR